MNLAYHLLWRTAYMIGNAIHTITSCHHSIPRLNASNDETNLSDGILISLSSPANPRPWNNPKKNIAIILDRLPQINSLSHKNTDVKATYAIERAIIGSTIRELNTSMPVPASSSVILWAIVKIPVNLKMSFHDMNTKRSESTNKIWSGPLSMCHTPIRKKSNMLSKIEVFWFLTILSMAAQFWNLFANSGVWLYANCCISSGVASGLAWIYSCNARGMSSWASIGLHTKKNTTQNKTHVRIKALIVCCIQILFNWIEYFGCLPGIENRESWV